MTEKDVMLGLAIKQGYVPKECKLRGILVMAIIQNGESPCARCNMDRKECGGKPKK